jgi:hypothetical protein
MLELPRLEDVSNRGSMLLLEGAEMVSRVIQWVALPLALAGCTVLGTEDRYRRSSVAGNWTLGDSNLAGWNYRDRPPQLVCDDRGTCYQVMPGYSFNGPNWGYHERREGWGNRRYRGWGERDRRFARPSDDVTCDRRTSVCYKDGHIDKTETRGFFGNRASRRSDSIRDRAGTGRVFVPKPGQWCDPREPCCLPKRGKRKH